MSVNFLRTCEFYFLPKPTKVDIYQKSRNCGSLMLEYGKNGFVLKNLFMQYKQIYKVDATIGFQFMNAILSVPCQENF